MPVCLLNWTFLRVRTRPWGWIEIFAAICFCLLCFGWSWHVSCRLSFTCCSWAFRGGLHVRRAPGTFRQFPLCWGTGSRGTSPGRFTRSDNSMSGCLSWLYTSAHLWGPTRAGRAMLAGDSCYQALSRPKFEPKFLRRDEDTLS